MFFIILFFPDVKNKIEIKLSYDNLTAIFSLSIDNKKIEKKI